jgi:hypothetical protein
LYLASLGAKVHRSGMAGMYNPVNPVPRFRGTLKVRSRSPLAPLLGLLLQRWSLNRGADDHIGVKCHAGRTNQALHRLLSVPLNLRCDNGNLQFLKDVSHNSFSLSHLQLAVRGERPCAVF